jgi:hypothetical protein
MGIANQTEPEERDAFYATPCQERGSIPRRPCSRQRPYKCVYNIILVQVLGQHIGVKTEMSEQVAGDPKRTTYFPHL